MKEFIRTVHNTAVATDDLLGDIFGQEARDRFLQISDFPKYVRLPFAENKRADVFNWIKSLDPDAVIVENTGIACRLSRESNWGSHIRYYLGDFHLQTLASMLPPLILDPQPHETVLDIAAAPGSKTSEIADMMGNTGRLVANDSSRDRLLGLISNLDRLGIKNTVITNKRGEQLGNLLPCYFDRVLVDAPCSSIGTPLKWKSVQNWVKPKNIKNIVTTQVKLLLSAIKVLKKNGILVYSTCTLNPMENEAVVDWVLKNTDLEVERIDDSFGLQKMPPLYQWRGLTFDKRVDHALKISPVDNPTEGFFIARFRKREKCFDSDITTTTFATAPNKTVADLFDSYKIAKGQIRDCSFHSQGNKLYLTSSEWEEGIPPFTVKSGLKIAEQRNQAEWRFTPTGAQFFGPLAHNRTIELDQDSWTELMAKRKIKTLLNGGYYILKWNDRAVTYGQVDNGKLKLKIGRPFYFALDD